MGISVIPAPAAGKTPYVVTLLSGTSWTPPAGCLYVNATLIGGGGSNRSGTGSPPGGGQKIASSVATTPGVAISYAIGAGASTDAAGGNTTFTGATTANGGSRSGAPQAGETVLNANIAVVGAISGADGKIELEYWV